MALHVTPPHRTHPEGPGPSSQAVSEHLLSPWLPSSPALSATAAHLPPHPRSASPLLTAINPTSLSLPLPPRLLPRLTASSQPPCLELASLKLLRSAWMFAVPQPRQPSQSASPAGHFLCLTVCRASVSKHPAWDRGVDLPPKGP